MRLINVDALIERLKQYAHRYDDDDEIPYSFIYDSFIYEVEQEQTVDAVPVRHGKWIYGNDFHCYTASCSVCGYQRRTDIKATGWNQWKYCPHCGAKMDK